MGVQQHLGKVIDLFTLRCRVDLNQAISLALQNLLLRRLPLLGLNLGLQPRMHQRSLRQVHCHALGVASRFGIGRSQDPESAIESFSKACKDGHATACMQLADFQEVGDMCDVEPRKAIASRDKACQLGAGGACLTLGESCSRGEIKYCTAEYESLYFIRACGNGALHACRMAAEAYEKARGVSADPVKAKELFKKGCASGDTQACGR